MLTDFLASHFFTHCPLLVEFHLLRLPTVHYFRSLIHSLSFPPLHVSIIINVLISTVAVIIMPSNQPAAGHLAVQPQYLSSQPSSQAKASEPNRNRHYDPKKQHITETPLTRANWYKHVNWLNVFLIVGIPLYGCVQALWTPLMWQTALFAVAYYFMTGLGITAGKLFWFYIYVTDLQIIRLP